jgi:hypothetical protein
MKAHVGIYGNETADRLAKEATQNQYVTYSRIPKSTIKKETREESIRKWQNQWEETTKGAITKEFLSKCRKKTGSEFTIKPKCYNNYEWAWKYSILPTPIKNHRQSRLSTQKRHTNNRPFDISV